MKKINNILKFAAFSIPLISFLVLPFQNWAPIASVSIENKNLGSEIDLATKPLSSSIIDENHRKLLVDDNTVADLYQGNSVLSTHTINTVRSNEHYFNFIIDPVDNYVNIIATPIDANIGEPIVLKTDFTSVVDSAIYLNENLILIGTKDDAKFLANYQINSFFDEANRQHQLVLEAKSQIDVSNLFASILMTNKKFALSPFAKNLDNTSEFNLILWPMGATVADFNSNPRTVIHEVLIDANDKMSIKNLELNFSLSSSDEIVSITPMQIIDNSGQVNATKFYAFTRGQNADTAIKILEFGLEGSTTSFDVHAVPETNYVKPDLNKVAPYAMVRADENNDFYLFWINQNSAPRSAAVPATPEAIIRVKVAISEENNDFDNITQDSITRINFQEIAEDENIVNRAQIHQIHYALGDNTGDSYMSLRFNNAFFANDNVQFNNFWTGSFPLNVPFHDGTEIIDSFILETTMLEWFSKSENSSINELIALENNDVNVMTTIANGIVNQVGIDHYGDANILTRSSSHFLEKPPIFQVSRRVDDYLLVWNTSFINQQIYLPQTQVLEGLSEPSDITSTYKLPLKIKDINFVKNFDAINEKITPFPTNSILWYARYFINDIFEEIFYGHSASFNLIIVGSVTFSDENGMIINQDLDSDGTAPDNATAVELSVTVPRPIVSGMISPAPLTIQMKFIDNPGSPSTGNEIVTMNPAYIANSASSYANVLNALKESGKIPENQSVIGTDNANLFNIDSLYLEQAFQTLEVEADDFLGELRVSFEFQDQNGNVHLNSFALTGFQADYILIPIVLGPIFIFGLIILIIVLVLNRKNAQKAAQSLKAGKILSSKLATQKIAPTKITPSESDIGEVVLEKSKSETKTLDLPTKKLFNPPKPPLPISKSPVNHPPSGTK